MLEVLDRYSQELRKKDFFSDKKLHLEKIGNLLKDKLGGTPNRRSILILTHGIEHDVSVIIEKMIFGDEFERTRESYIKRKLGYSAELEIGDIQIYQGLKSWLDAVKVVAENNDCAVALVKNWKGSGLTSSFEQWHVAETSYLLS